MNVERLPSRLRVAVHEYVVSCAGDRNEKLVPADEGKLGSGHFDERGVFGIGHQDVRDASSVLIGCSTRRHPDRRMTGSAEVLHGRLTSTLDKQGTSRHSDPSSACAVARR